MTRISYWTPFQEKRVWLSVFHLLPRTPQIMRKCPMHQCESEWGEGSLSTTGAGCGAPDSALFGGSSQFSYPGSLTSFYYSLGTLMDVYVLQNWYYATTSCSPVPGMRQGRSSTVVRGGDRLINQAVGHAWVTEETEHTAFFSASYVPGDVGASFPPC